LAWRDRKYECSRECDYRFGNHYRLCWETPITKVTSSGDVQAVTCEVNALCLYYTFATRIQNNRTGLVRKLIVICDCTCHAVPRVASRLTVFKTRYRDILQKKRFSDKRFPEAGRLPAARLSRRALAYPTYR